MTKNKYKVGQKVKVLHSDYADILVGDVLPISWVSSYGVDLKTKWGAHHYFSVHEIKPHISLKKPYCVIDQDGAKLGFYITLKEAEQKARNLDRGFPSDTHKVYRLKAVRSKKK